MKRIVIAGMIAAIAVMSSGCVSSYVLNGSRERVALRKAYQSNNTAAIEAVRSGNMVGIGIDISNLEALKERPLLQFGAALADAALMYGTYQGIMALEKATKKEDSATQAKDLTSGAIVIRGNNSGTLNTVDATVAVDGNNTGDINTGGDPEAERIRAEMGN